MPNDNEEVKPPVAEIPAVKPEGEEDEEVLTADDLTEEEKQEAQKDTEAHSSEAEKPVEGEEAETETEILKVEAEVDEPEDVKPEVKTEDVIPDKTPKAVEGETVRERALRQETARVKALLRQERGKKLISDVPVTAKQDELTADEKKVLETFDPEQVNNMDKLFDVLAKKKGFVRSDQLSKQQTVSQLTDTFDDWMESHPELDEKNDPDGLLWKQVQAEYGRYKQPGNAKDLKVILNRIHRDIFGIETDNKGLKKVEAKQEKLKVASHSASAGGSGPSKANTKADPELKQLVDSGALKGFTAEEIAAMGL